MTALGHPRFWIAFAVVLGGLSMAGAGVARLLVPEPPSYHRTTYFEFPLPAGWRCDQSGTESVCLPPGPPPHPAIMIIAAKWRNAADTREAYVDHLSTPQRVEFTPGEATVSEVLHVRESMIGGHLWIDAMHRDSELAGFRTRYLATVTTDIGVLVTYSVANGEAATYDPLLDRTIAELDIYQRSQ